jgi:hypothetical protein
MEGAMNNSTLLAAWKRPRPRGLQSFFSIVAVIVTFSFCSAIAQTDGTWDGTWKGTWIRGAATSVTIKEGRVVEYRFLDRPHEILESNISGDTVTFSIPLFQYNVTRTGPASATIQSKRVTGEASSGTLAKIDEGPTKTNEKAAKTQPTPKAKAAEKTASSSSAWCENDCRTLCQKVAASVENCIAQYNCSKFPASPCAGAAAVNARAAQTQGGARSGSSTWYYEDCAARCDATSGSPAERGGCYAAVCTKYPRRK